MGMVFLIFLVVSFLILLIYSVSWRVKPYLEHNSPFECGFEPFSYPRITFSLHYFLITLVFLIFDMEIVFLMPTPLVGLISVSSGLTLILILFLIFYGLLHEWWYGSLDWVE